MSPYFIDHQCPQCGAPATLTETDRLVRCSYCKVKSYLQPKDVFRYLLPHNAPAGCKLIYVPYWRFKGMLFSCSRTGIQHRFVDHSINTLSSSPFPPSLGLRSQAMKLSFLRSGVDGWFLKPQVSLSQAMDGLVRQHTPKKPEHLFHQALIGEILSLIYAPFYMREKMMDAVLNRPVSSIPVESFDIEQRNADPAVNSIHFMATICPNCGWDLEGDRDTLVLHCTNCDSMWRTSKKALKRVAVAHIPQTEETRTIFLPFWRIRAKVSGIDFGSYAELVRQANLPKAIRPEWRRRPVYFWGPAFKIKPKSLLRLTHQMTLAQPRENLVPDIPDGPFHPVTLPLNESIETLKLNLAGILRPKKKIQESLQKVEVEPKRGLLVYLPFSIRNHDLVQTQLNIAVNRNQLALAGNL